MQHHEPPGTVTVLHPTSPVTAPVSGNTRLARLARMSTEAGAATQRARVARLIATDPHSRAGVRARKMRDEQTAAALAAHLRARGINVPSHLTVVPTD